MANITEQTRLESYLKTPTSKRKALILNTLGQNQMTARMIAEDLGFSDLNAVKPRLTELKSKAASLLLVKPTMSSLEDTWPFIRPTKGKDTYYSDAVDKCLKN